MTANERVMTTINHIEPDRVPCDYWADSEVTGRLLKHFGFKDKEELLQYFRVDLRYITGPSYVGQELRTYKDGTVEDLWGVRRKVMSVERGEYSWKYKHVAASPLESAETTEEIEHHNWPNPDWWDYSMLEADCDRFAGYAVVNAGDRLDRTAQLKPMMYLRGMTQTYIDLIENPQIAFAIIEHIKDYFLEYNKRVFEASNGKIDIFMMGDDFGTQNGMMMDIRTWRKFFKDGFKAYIDLAHKYNIKVMHHTCGSVVDLIPDFIESGLDILQSLQPKAAGMDLGKLKREYGRYIAFHGSIDIQETLPYGNVGDVRKMVEERMAAGKQDGGFIICTAHNIQPDTPTENILVLFEAYKEFGEY